MIEEKLKELCAKESDINLHLPIIRDSVREGDYVVEFGVRDCVSTWALLANKPKEMCCVDVVQPPMKNIQEVTEAANRNGTKLSFLIASSLNVRMKKVDVIFIDTIHMYSQLIKELWLHESVVRKHIVLHDTEIPEMKSCLTDFLYSPNWIIKEQVTTHMGLTVLERV